MIVIAYTTPLNYLVLIGQSNLLPRLYGRVLLQQTTFRASAKLLQAILDRDEVRRKKQEP